MENTTTSEHIIDITEANFEADVLLKSKTTPVLIDFWAEWCGPCKSLGPVLEKLANAYQGRFILAKVDVDQAQSLAAAFQIRSIPTVILMMDGQPVDVFNGALPEGEIRHLLDRHLPAASEEPADNAEQNNNPALDPNLEPAEAITILRQHIEKEPDNAALKQDLIEALLKHGQPDEAGQWLEKLADNTNADSNRTERLKALLEITQLVAEAPDDKTLEAQIQADPEAWPAHDWLGLRLIAKGQYEQGLEQLLHLLKHARHWQDGQAQKHLLLAFSTIGDTAIISPYRRRMASLLF